MMKIVSSHFLTVTEEDWSQVRSPSRARRRRKMGHPQRIRHVVRPDPKLYTTADGMITGHPETIAIMMEALAARNDVAVRERHDNLFYGSFAGYEA